MVFWPEILSRSESPFLNVAIWLNIHRFNFWQDVIIISILPFCQFFFRVFFFQLLLSLFLRWLRLGTLQNVLEVYRESLMRGFLGSVDHFLFLLVPLFFGSWWGHLASLNHPCLNTFGWHILALEHLLFYTFECARFLNLLAVKALNSMFGNGAMSLRVLDKPWHRLRAIGVEICLPRHVELLVKFIRKFLVRWS